MRLFNTANQMYAHIVWTTMKREPLIDEEVKLQLRRIIDQAAETDGYEILAFEAVVDHVHLLIRFKPTHMLAHFIKDIKGKSSRVISSVYHKEIAWQKGYGITTVGPKALKAAIEYVKNQKQHHPERAPE